MFFEASNHKYILGEIFKNCFLENKDKVLAEATTKSMIWGTGLSPIQLQIIGLGRIGWVL